MGLTCPRAPGALLKGENTMYIKNSKEIELRRNLASDLLAYEMRIW